MVLWVEHVDFRRTTVLPTTVRTTVGEEQGDTRVGDGQTKLLEELASILQREVQPRRTRGTVRAYPVRVSTVCAQDDGLLGPSSVAHGTQRR